MWQKLPVSQVKCSLLCFLLFYFYPTEKNKSRAEVVAKVAGDNHCHRRPLGTTHIRKPFIIELLIFSSVFQFCLWFILCWFSVFFFFFFCCSLASSTRAKKQALVIKYRSPFGRARSSCAKEKVERKLETPKLFLSVGALKVVFSMFFSLRTKLMIYCQPINRFCCSAGIEILGKFRVCLLSFCTVFPPLLTHFHFTLLYLNCRS